MEEYATIAEIEIRTEAAVLEDQSNIKNVIGEEIRVTGQQVLMDNEDRRDLETYFLIQVKYLRWNQSP